MKTRRFPLFHTIPVVLILMSAAGCPSTKIEDAWPDKPGAKVLTSFAPVDSLVLNVVGDNGAVIPIQTGQGPHEHFDPPQKLLKLGNKADVMFIIGLDLDEAVAGKIKEASGKPDFKIVELAEKIDDKLIFQGAAHEEHGEKHEGHEHGKDPHVWMSPKLARTMVEGIRAEMKKVDPAHAAGYDKRAADYLAKLKNLENDGIAMLKDKKELKIIAFHDSLHYFGDCFGIKISDSIQLEPGVEPTANHMKDLIKLCKDENIRIIAVEPQFPENTSAATILAELKKAGIEAEFVVVDPMETAGESELNADFYERIMRGNLERLSKAMR
jgi:zinc transport system substrate-binding protein